MQPCIKDVRFDSSMGFIIVQLCKTIILNGIKKILSIEDYIYKLEFISMLLFVYRNRIAQVSFHSATEILTPELNDNQFHSYYSAIPV